MQRSLYLVKVLVVMAGCVAAYVRLCKKSFAPQYFRRILKLH